MLRPEVPRDQEPAEAEGNDLHTDEYDEQRGDAAAAEYDGETTHHARDRRA